MYFKDNHFCKKETFYKKYIKAKEELVAKIGAKMVEELTEEITTQWEKGQFNFAQVVDRAILAGFNKAPTEAFINPAKKAFSMTGVIASSVAAIPTALLSHYLTLTREHLDTILMTRLSRGWQQVVSRGLLFAGTWVTCQALQILGYTIMNFFQHSQNIANLGHRRSFKRHTRNFGA